MGDSEKYSDTTCSSSALSNAFRSLGSTTVAVMPILGSTVCMNCLQARTVVQLDDLGLRDLGLFLFIGRTGI